jgi:hypothetical protein
MGDGSAEVDAAGVRVDRSAGSSHPAWPCTSVCAGVAVVAAMLRLTELVRLVQLAALRFLVAVTGLSYHSHDRLTTINTVGQGGHP